MPIKAIIYDVDGTLVDSEPLHVEAWNKALESYGCSLSWLSNTFVRTMAGKKPLTIAEEMVDVIQLLIQPIDLLATKSRLYTQLAKQRLELADGALESITSLNKSGYRLAIGTSLDSAFLSSILTRFAIADMFECIVTGDHITKGKPDPETYLKVADEMSLQPNQCLVFEDAETGIAAAKAADMWCVAVKGTAAITQDTSKADITIESLNEATPQFVKSLCFS